MKKILSALIVITLLLNTNFCVFAESIKGHVQETDILKEELDPEIFTGKYEVLDKEKTVTMQVSQVLSAGYTQVGDEFFAEISQDVTVNDGIVLPVGTLIHGVVNTIASPKNMGRDGWIVMDFDYLVTPDGRQIPIKGFVSTKDKPIVGASKVVAEHVGYTAAGGVFGGLVALNLLGLEAAIASQGYTILGGAAIGGAMGLISAVSRKGDAVMIKPGDNLKIKILSNVALPVFTDTAFKQEEVQLEGLRVDINDVKFGKDPFGADNTITLKLSIANNTKYTFSTFDIALENDLNSVFHPSPFGKDDSLWFKTINSGDRAIGELSFSVHERKRRHWLVFYDKATKKPLAKISVDNAIRDLKPLNKKSKSR